jgi:DNA-binding NarL/FixJ family response regulator
VNVEQITADHKTYDVSSVSNEKLPALLRDLEIDYTALSLVAPEKVRFRYKLEGWDSDWQDVGNRRQAFYSNLPPRHYKFRVLACNNSGVWNETGAALDFSIAPAYYQTSWFFVLCTAGFLGLLWAAYQMRVRQVTEQVRHRMEGRLEERERIARDLHDTLLQSVQGLILKFHAVSRRCDDAVRLEIEKTLDHADEVMAEGRNRVRNLRATAMSLADLPAAFRRVADETAPGREATFKVVVEGKMRELNPMILEEVFSIGREALTNALIHSGGRNVEVEITYDARQFRLRINDDGRGVDPKVLEAGGRAGHWGMQGMRERARKIGGQLEFWSREGTGTEVELKIPATTGALRPDIILMDLQMPVMNGTDAILAIRQDAPNARIIVLTTYSGDAQAVRAFKAGASGYLLKNTLRKELAETIRIVHAGKKKIPPEIAVEMAEHHTDDALSEREIEVLRQVAGGNANKIVADHLSISEETVKAHMRSILSKLGANDRTHAVTIAVKRGIIEI